MCKVWKRVHPTELILVHASCVKNMGDRLAANEGQMMPPQATSPCIGCGVKGQNTHADGLWLSKGVIMSLTRGYCCPVCWLKHIHPNVHTEHGMSCQTGVCDKNESAEEKRQRLNTDQLKALKEAAKAAKAANARDKLKRPAMKAMTAMKQPMKAMKEAKGKKQGRAKTGVQWQTAK